MSRREPGGEEAGAEYTTAEAAAELHAAAAAAGRAHAAPDPDRAAAMRRLFDHEAAAWEARGDF